MRKRTSFVNLASLFYVLNECKLSLLNSGIKLNGGFVGCDYITAWDFTDSDFGGAPLKQLHSAHMCMVVYLLLILLACKQ